MNKYLIRYNKSKGMPGRGTVDHVWRVFENGKEFLFKNIKINVPSHSEQSGEDWNISCDGIMTIDKTTSTAIINSTIQKENIKLNNKISNFSVQKILYPISPYNSPGKEYACYWEDFLTDDDLNYILSRPEWLTSENAGVGVQGKVAVEEQIRRTNISWMYPDENNTHIWDKISTAISIANSRYFNYDLTGCYEPAQLGAYSFSEKQFYDWHCDQSPSNTGVFRKLSMSILLNDPSEFEGGEFQTKYNGDKIIPLEQKKGRAWFFPSWMLHRVTPVTKGIRRSLVLWVGGPAFK